MKIRLVTAALLLPAVATAAPITVFNVPGASTTCGASIASNGLVAGDSSTNGALQTETGFLYQNGVFATPVGTPTGSAVFEGANRNGVVIGFTFSTSSFSLGIAPFLLRRGKLTDPTVAAGSVFTLSAIADSGLILGQLQKPQSPANPFTFGSAGFELAPNGTVTLIDDGTGTTDPAGMDETGQYVVGLSVGAATPGWLYHAGTFSPVAVPIPNAFTQPRAVDRFGRVSGSYTVGTSFNAVSHGFLLRGGKYRTWDVPGASSTEILGANGSGQITGCFTDATGLHGFIAKP